MRKLLRGAGWVVGGLVFGVLSLFSGAFILVVLIDGRGVAGVLGRVALLVPLAMYFFAFRNLLRSALSKGWSTVEGKIVSARIGAEKEYSEEGGAHKKYKANVVYEYTLDGQQYFGNQIAFGYESTPVLSEHEETVERYPPGQTVTVHYDRRNPRLAVLETKTQWWPFIWRSAVAFFILLLITGFSVNQ